MLKKKAKWDKKLEHDGPKTCRVCGNTYGSTAGLNYHMEAHYDAKKAKSFGMKHITRRKK